MAEENPYAPPLSDLISIHETPAKDRLADRFTRFTASILDSIIGVVFAFPTAYFLGIWSYAAKGASIPFSLLLVATALGVLWYFLVQGYLLKKNGQTVGKVLTGIRIVDLEGRVPDFWRLICLRYLPISLSTLIPIVGPYVSLVDVLFIFRADRRCLHDLLAGTKVVLANSTR